MTPVMDGEMKYITPVMQALIKYMTVVTVAHDPKVVIWAHKEMTGMRHPLTI